MYYKIQAIRLLDKLDGHLDYAALVQFITDRGWNVVLCADKEEYVEYAQDLHILKQAQNTASFSYSGSRRAIFLIRGAADNIALLREICHIICKHKVVNNIVGGDLRSRKRADLLASEIISMPSGALCWYKRRKWFYAVFITMFVLLLSTLLHSMFFRHNAVSVSAPTPTAIAQKEEIGVEQKVYITSTGERYHRAECYNLTSSSIAISLEDAQKLGKSPCRVCLPQNIN